jgi:GTP:adenosylcobinamide-phosphate guanylyltransferase
MAVNPESHEGRVQRKSVSRVLAHKRAICITILHHHHHPRLREHLRRGNTKVIRARGQGGLKQRGLKQSLSELKGLLISPAAEMPAKGLGGIKPIRTAAWGSQ